MEAQKHKVSYQNYDFQLHFKTQYCCSITAIDRFQGKKFSNSSVQFSKLQSNTVLKALQEKSSKQITCKITEVKVQNQHQEEKPIRQKDQSKTKNDNKDSKPYNKRCLKLQFIVTFSYILPFSQVVILYEIQSYRKVQNIIPPKLNNKVAKQLRKQIQSIDNAIPNPEQQVSVSKQLQKQQYQSDREIIFFIGINIAFFIIFLTYWSFLQYILYEAIMLGVVYFYCCQEKHSVYKFEADKGFYKIQVTGNLCVQNYNSNGNDDFQLYLYTDGWNSQSIRLYGRSIYSYGYSFTGTFLVNLKKREQLQLKIKKNTKIYPVNINCVVITVENLPQFLSK